MWVHFGVDHWDLRINWGDLGSIPALCTASWGQLLRIDSFRHDWPDLCSQSLQSLKNMCKNGILNAGWLCRTCSMSVAEGTRVTAVLVIILLATPSSVKCRPVLTGPVLRTPAKVLSSAGYKVRKLAKDEIWSLELGRIQSENTSQMSKIFVEGTWER